MTILKISIIIINSILHLIILVLSLYFFGLVEIFSIDSISIAIILVGLPYLLVKFFPKQAKLNFTFMIIIGSFLINAYFEDGRVFFLSGICMILFIPFHWLKFWLYEKFGYAFVLVIIFNLGLILSVYNHYFLSSALQLIIFQILAIWARTLATQPKPIQQPRLPKYTTIK